MASLADFQRSLPEGLEVSHGGDCLQEAVDEMVFVQDAAGNYLSFSWSSADQYNLKPEQVLGSCTKGVFYPTDVASYIAQIKQVLARLLPERFRCYFQCGDHCLLLDLVMSPVLLPDQPPKAVVVAGRLLEAGSGKESVDPNLSLSLVSSHSNPYSTFFPNSDRYQKQLTEIAWNISRTLELETVQQQTVQGLGKALGANQCIFCDYDPHQRAKVQVVAEYRQDSIPPRLSAEFWLADEPHFNEAVQTLKPVSVQEPPSAESHQGAEKQSRSRLIIATCYQEQPNGLIVLYQYDRDRVWSEAELELIQNLADQVGTALAHAKLLNKSQMLAAELQKANSSLLQKHRELEEARYQAEEASRLKSEFLANTSHELRTPLNGMIGFLKLIMDGMADDPEEQSDFIKEAYHSALHLLHIINDVLDIARIEAGKMQIELSSVKLDELLDDVERFAYSQQVQQKKNDLYFEIQKPPTNDEIIIYGNYLRLKQVMFNLVGNAIKFTHEGGITVSVEVIKKKVMVQNQELPGMVKVRVADTGIGVSLDKQDKLFQSFSQVDGSRTRQYGGTGLGLAISQKLIEAMGGVVNFYSMGEGLGATVTFTVPLYQEPIL
ncbi:GAF domain-containing protein [Kovacikia minuta CCNUW1]|uniref:GAF domain-containing hybrid sensor histidine kinase/response regulator n=1 Tax=Kovacikia minuta TaxID=2931930 RepID=UPI001CC92903|nr:ATP-binding protein [Kovacikia minuta]UBF28342.1 GAF domain-containing protein [Kovacikia minuta CCNUW1]